MLNALFLDLQKLPLMSMNSKEKKLSLKDEIETNCNLGYFMDSTEFLLLLAEFQKETGECKSIYDVVKKLHDENEFISLTYIIEMLKKLEGQISKNRDSPRATVQIKDDAWFYDMEFPMRKEQFWLLLNGMKDAIKSFKSEYVA